MTIGTKLQLLLVGGLLAACQPDASGPPQQYQQHGVAFSFPADWKVDEAEQVDSGAFILNCEKQGLSSSGLVSLSWYNDSLDLKQVQETYRDQLKTNPIYKLSNLHFSPAEPGYYGRHPALRGSFTLKLLSLPHIGSVATFYSGGKTFAIITQEAVEDTAQNRAGLQLIAQTLRGLPAKP